MVLQSEKQFITIVVNLLPVSMYISKLYIDYFFQIAWCIFHTTKSKNNANILQMTNKLFQYAMVYCFIMLHSSVNSHPHTMPTMPCISYNPPICLLRGRVHNYMCMKNRKQEAAMSQPHNTA